MPGRRERRSASACAESGSIIDVNRRREIADPAHPQRPPPAQVMRVMSRRRMTPTVLAISAAYVLIAVLLLTVGLTARFAWWVKAAAIVVTSAVLRRGVLRHQEPAGLAGRRAACPRDSSCCGCGWSSPIRRSAIPARSTCGSRRWTRTMCPTGLPRAYRLPYSRHARRPLGQGARRDHAGQAAAGPRRRTSRERKRARRPRRTGRGRDSAAPGSTVLDLEQLQFLQQAQRVEFAPLPTPTLPPKGP